MPPSAWTAHLAAYRQSHPSLCLKECMIGASKTYRKSAAKATKPTKPTKTTRTKQKATKRPTRTASDLGYRGRGTAGCKSMSLMDMDRKIEFSAIKKAEKFPGMDHKRDFVLWTRDLIEDGSRYEAALAWGPHREQQDTQELNEASCLGLIKFGTDIESDMVFEKDGINHIKSIDTDHNRLMKQGCLSSVKKLTITGVGDGQKLVHLELSEITSKSLELYKEYCPG